jgi:integrase
VNTFFYIRPTSDKKTAFIYKGISVGTNVISRVSTKIKIPINAWDEENSTIRKTKIYNPELDLQKLEFWKAGNPNANKPNNQIENNCFIKFCLDTLESSHSHKLETKVKYKGIINSLYRYCNYHFHSHTIPIKYIRTNEFRISYVEFLRNKDSIKKRGVRKLPKKNTTIINYVSVINYFFQEFNEIYPDCPITLISTRKLGRRESQPDNSPKLSDIKLLIDYQPEFQSKQKNGNGVTSDELFLAKEMFLFQFFCTGLRLSDTIVLRTKQFSRDGISIQMKKTNDNLYILPDYHIARHLGSFHPNIFSQAISNTKLGMMEFTASEMMNYILKMSYGKKIREFTLYDLEDYISNIKQTDNSIQELINFLEKCLDTMKGKIAEEFFYLISKMPNKFVFPYLNNDIFKHVKNLNEIDYSEEMLKEITRGKNLYNNRLQRISKLLDCNFKFSSHQARHAFANLMHEADASVEEISLNLGHRHISTTMKYLKRFPSNIRKMGLEKFSQITKNL